MKWSRAVLILLPLMGVMAYLGHAVAQDADAKKYPLTRFCTEPKVSSHDLIEAANFLIDLKQKKAIAELRNSFSTFDNYSDRNLRLYLLCRVLFVPKAKEPLRPARIGASNLPHESMPLTKWPLFPVAESGKSFFVLSEVYEGTGIPERLVNYLEYCLEDGMFRTKLLSVPNKEEGEKDLTDLFGSARWREIRWSSEVRKEATIRDLKSQVR